MLTQVQHHHRPFDFFTCEEALPTDLLERLMGLYDEDLTWERHHDSFYRASLCEISARLSKGSLQKLARRMEVISGLPLAEQIRVTVQRMEPGQYAKPHTDRPLVGYESLRLIVQLNPDWEPAHGGVLQLHPDATGRSIALARPPYFNTAFGFVMGQSSFHSVSPVVAERRTAVFNFWHIGNTEALAAWVQEQFEGMRFDRQPSGVTPLAIQADATLPEEDSFRAGCLAHLVQHWGFEDERVVEAYRHGLFSQEQPDEALETQLARWIHRLHLHDFDGVGWADLSARYRALKDRSDPRLQDVFRLAFPR